MSVPHVNGTTMPLISRMSVVSVGAIEPGLEH
jgi:hypothetical protein